MATVIEELVFAFSHKIDNTALDRAAKNAKNNAQQTEVAYKRAALEVEKAQKQLAKAVDQASKDAAKAALDAATEARDAAREALEDMGRDVDKLSIKLSTKLGGAIKSIGKGLGAGVLGGAGVVGAVLGGVVSHGLEQAKELDDWSRRLGVTTTEVQRLRGAAASLGVEEGSVLEAGKKLREGLGELAATGGGPAKEGLEALGITFGEIKDLGLEDQLGLVADALNDIPDPADRVNAALKIGGEDLLKILPTLEGGSAGFRALGDAVEDSGAVLDEDLIKSLRETDRTLKKVEMQVGAASATILAEAAPAIEDMAKDFAAWTKENDELIKQDLPTVLTAIASGMAAIAAAAADVVRFVSAADDELLEFLEHQSVQDVWLRELDAANGGRTGTRGAASFLDPVNETNRLARIQNAAAPVNEAMVQQAGTTIAAQRLAQTGRDRTARLRSERRATARAKAAAAAQGGGGGGGKTAEQKEAEKRLAQAFVDLKTAGIDEELRSLGVRNAASELAISSSVKAAAESLAKGNSKSVAKKAGIGALSGFVGADLSKRQTDPLLNAIFGNDELPAVPLSDLERGQQPQVLISNIYNTYNVDVDIAVNGTGRDAATVASMTADEFDQRWGDKVEQVSKFSKVVKAR